MYALEALAERDDVLGGLLLQPMTRRQKLAWASEYLEYRDHLDAHPHERSESDAVEEDAAPEPDRVEQPGTEPDLSGRPLAAFHVLQALRDFATDASIRDVSRGALTFRSARRVYSWVKSGAVWWDPAARTVRTAPGYRLVGGGSPDEPTLQLVRV
jgi:hypothetical protein